MYNNMMNNFDSFFPSYHFTGGFFGPIFVLLMTWSLVWKGLALWKSARQGQNIWFVILLLVNTFGILDILYIYAFNKKFKSVEK